jgi:hypothetical protein
MKLTQMGGGVCLDVDAHELAACEALLRQHFSIDAGASTPWQFITINPAGSVTNAEPVTPPLTSQRDRFAGFSTVIFVSISLAVYVFGWYSVVRLIARWF